MPVAETARLIVDLSLKGNFARQLSKSSAALGKFDARLDATESRAYRAGQQIGTGIKRAAGIGAVGLGILAFQVGRGLESLVELEQQTAQTNAAIKSTKGVAGITASEIRTLAEEFESMNATIGDETIQETENLLLTFTNIRKKAFKPTLQAILDINQRLGRGPEGLAGTARQVGKALNDPTKGLAALTRIGITFDAQTTERIKNLQREGKLYEAQALILGELDTRFGGSFLAGGQTTAGKVAKFHDAIEDLQRTLAIGLFPVVSNLADALSDLFADPAIQKGVREFGEDLGKFLTPARIKEGIAALKDLALTIGPAFRAAASGIGLVISAFSKLPPDIRNLLVGAFAVNKLTGGLVTNIAGGLAGAIGGALKTIVAGNVTVIGKSVIGPGGVPAGVGRVDTAGGIAGTLKTVLKTGLALTVAGAITAAAIPIGEAFKRILPKELQGPGGRGESDSQRAQTLVLERLNATLRAQQQKQLREGTPNPDRREAMDTFRQQKVAETFVRASALRAEELASNTGSVIPGAIDTLRTSSVAAVDSLANTTSTQGALDRSATRSGALQVAATTRMASASNAAIIAGATRAGSAAIVGAIFAARPIVNVTAVNRTSVVNNRYGPGNGSYGTSSGE